MIEVVELYYSGLSDSNTILICRHSIVGGGHCFKRSEFNEYKKFDDQKISCFSKFGKSPIYLGLPITRFMMSLFIKLRSRDLNWKSQAVPLCCSIKEWECYVDH